MYIARNIKYLRKSFGVSQPELAEKLGYKSFTTIQKWESGVSTPPLEAFAKMSDLFNIDLDQFARTDLTSRKTVPATAPNPYSVPVFSRIPADVPLEAITDITEYVPLTNSMLESRLKFFALRLSGDYEHSKYQDNDTVIFEKCGKCENGDDCAVRLKGEEVTFKKVIFEGDQVILKPLDLDFITIQIDRNRMDSLLEIIGIAREVRRKI